MMNYASVLGSIGTGMGLIRAVPQLVRLSRARAAYGVSLDSAATSSIVSFGWVAYAFMTHQVYVILATGASGLIFALVAIFAVRYGRRLNEFKVAPLWFVVLLLSGVLIGKNGLGIMLPISVLAANIPQLWVAYKEGNLIDLSLGTWALSMTDGLIWGVYALIQHDIPILGYGIFQLITSGMIVLIKLLHSAREKNQPSGTGS
jgi:uncharacterized protein with PQ loop repeat